MHGQQNVKT